jgi:hypothetical protein
MYIFDFIDCEDCVCRKHRSAHLTADPYYSEPAESECRDGDFGEEHPCDRMLSRIDEGIRDGDFDGAAMLDRNGELQRGNIAAREYLEEDKMDPENPSWYKEADFSSAPYWWVPDNCGAADNEPYPLGSLEEVFDEFFR